MDTNRLKKFAQDARTTLMSQVAAKLDLVLEEGSLARREAPAAVRELEGDIAATSKPQIIEKVAYTWFNRFCALRFMDANGYTNPRTVTPADGQTRPELLAEAAAGNTDIPAVMALLDGRTPSRDAQTEAYRMLLVAACNHWHGPMPFMFERSADYTELLLPDDLLSPDSILSCLRAALTDEDCADVEVIGWLYQFYISEKKDQVFAGLKKNVKITAENIPAATQLFTPHWIVRYLVENSLGRLWLLNHPTSTLATRMEYYIAPEEAETDFLRVGRPEEIRLCDPACGSGHMLTYAFDLLYAIYEEQGYDPAQIPDLILTHNLYGVEIDDRAGALAAFALVMKAAGRRRRFLRSPIQPNICVMQNVAFTHAELTDYAAAVGPGVLTADVLQTLGQFDQAKNFGALIVPKLSDVAPVAARLAAVDFSGNLFMAEVHQRVMQVLRMAEALSPKYHVVVANPPYMGGKGMNGELADFLKEHYPDVKSDVFSSFILRNSEMTLKKGQLGFMTPFVWMFIASYEKLRTILIEKKTITGLVQLEYSGFDGATVPICIFTVQNGNVKDFSGAYIRLSDFRGHINQAPKTLEAIRNPECGYFFRANARDFSKAPGNPIAYWASQKLLDTFDCPDEIGEIAAPRQGLATSDNARFLRFWGEVSQSRSSFDSKSHLEADRSGCRWFPYNKGGSFRKWFGNNDYVVDWEDGGRALLELASNLYGSPTRTIKNMKFYFLDSITWSAISSAKLSVRRSMAGFLFDQKGQCIFSDDQVVKNRLIGFLNSKVAFELLRFLSPTLDFVSGTIGKLPYLSVEIVELSIERMFALARSDWDAYETSWDFSTLPLLNPAHRGDTLAQTYATLRQHWQGMTTQMQALEEQNNRIFIDAYGLADELTPDVPLEEITLTCNPAYRYGGKKTDAELEAALLADTVAEFLHYAVGCMFGRYSLDAPGLILANQGDGLADYLARIPEPTFAPDADNVIPMLDEDWFPDDVTERFRRFLRVTFGEAHFQDNLAFIEAALGRDIRKYFTRDFFNDHVKRYKKRPIYWLFSSPKGTFNALIYMHRYRIDTVSVVLNDYVREMISKLQSSRAAAERLSDSTSAPPADRTRALREVDRLGKMLAELVAWERDVVFPLAQARVAIDLDDGVKANYPRFGAALKPIKGLEAADD